MSRTIADLPTPGALPLGEQAYLVLRQSIVRCEFDPNERLRVEDLTRRFGFSSSPLREALSRLAEQGLVRAFDHRGFRVASISVEGIVDLTRVRLLIETEALIDAITHGDEVWEGSVVAAFHRLSRIEKTLPTGHHVLDDDWSDRHRAFHAALYAGCSSPILKLLVESLFDQAERYRRFSARYRKASRAKGKEHQRIVDAVLTRDAGLATTLIQAHIRTTERNVVDSLANMDSARAQ